MSPAPQNPPVFLLPLTHLKRAFGWNLGRVVPSSAEAAKLTAAGLTDPVVQRYAVWRRSLLIVTALSTLVAFVLACVDFFDTGLSDLTRFGVTMELAWLATAGMLPVACVIGIWFWKRPASSTWLTAAWAASFLMPFVYAIIPVSALYHMQPFDLGKAPQSTMTQPKPDDEEDDTPLIDPEIVAKAVALKEMVVEFVLSAGGYLLLLPAVLSLIPGVVNGCLRVKALMPAAQLPGWLLIWVAPAFLLFWLVILVLANHVVRSPLLVFGGLCWAGSPIWYSIFGKVFVQSHITEQEAAKIVRVKSLVGFFALGGLALLLAFVLTKKVVGLNVVGFDRAAAVSTKLEELSSQEDDVTLDDVQTSLAESKSFLYAFDLSSYQLIIDFLAKLLVVTAVFSDLALRATLAAWRNDRSFRSGTGATAYDTSASALATAFQPVAR
jgi:hypothetical protein